MLGDGKEPPADGDPTLPGCYYHAGDPGIIDKTLLLRSRQGPRLCISSGLTSVNGLCASV